MALLNILQFPDLRLKKLASPVETIDAEIEKLISDMFETMYETQGIGLAATQVNVHKRVVVIDVSNLQTEPLCLINPLITEKKGFCEHEEGCLSFPGVYAKVKRSKEVTVSFLNREGKAVELKADGLLSICIQHECDHLNGITFFDHLSRLKQDIIRKKLEKNRRKSL